jgi:septum formation protein
MTASRLVLASTSPYRSQLLKQLGIRFEQQSPEVDESPRSGEVPEALAVRLGVAKAQFVAARLAPAVSPIKAAASPQNNAEWLVIGSDQVCHLNNKIFNKPGNFGVALDQLSMFSGNWVNFTTSLALVGRQGILFQGAESFGIHFRALKAQEIRDYLELDEPYDCAGAIKVEAHGHMLLQGQQGRDINTLYGLPIKLLRESLAKLAYKIGDFR